MTAKVLATRKAPPRTRRAPGFTPVVSVGSYRVTIPAGIEIDSTAYGSPAWVEFELAPGKHKDLAGSLRALADALDPPEAAAR